MSNKNPKIFYIYRIFTDKMFDTSANKYLSNDERSVDSENIEMCSREDVLVLNPSQRQQTQRNVLNMTLLSLLLLLIISVSVITLMKFTYKSVNVHITEPQVSDDYIDLIFNANNVSTSAQCLNIKLNNRTDCNPDEPTITKEVCIKKGCCWSPTMTHRQHHRRSNNPLINNTSSDGLKSLIAVPNCYHPINVNNDK
ncbi:uncharacterized protein LOC128952126 [Oppia nitens]|uniref:uncharacterized protein LOC128952126 n=1 Tax=Oppia nitens TaxID=1686743 RepID=UPI0023DAF5A2|nr:uncharacterized protein LOC128952126 [Oppia nitens]